ncbi:MAG TPA: DUF2723 domain-containing protein, partial [Verrucomicrobiae bacterium]
KGDRKFIRDDGAQKAFSKLRSSIAGMYAWRLGQYCPPEYRPKNNEEAQALINEADFAFKQAFAFCPYSPEAVFRYINFLVQYNRFEEALIVAQTSLKLDPYNGQIQGLISQLQEFKKTAAQRVQTREQFQQMEDEAHANPADFPNIFKLAGFYMQAQQTNLVGELFDRTLTNSQISAREVVPIAQFYAQIGNMAKLEKALEKLVALTPGQPEVYYDLARLEAILGKNSEALQNLSTALGLNAKRLSTNSMAHDLLIEARQEPRFNPLRSLPEFQKIVPPN